MASSLFRAELSDEQKIALVRSRFEREGWVIETETCPRCGNVRLLALGPYASPSDQPVPEDWCEGELACWMSLWEKFGGLLTSQDPLPPFMIDWPVSQVVVGRPLVIAGRVRVAQILRRDF